MVFASSARRCAALLIVLVVAMLIASPFAAESRAQNTTPAGRKDNWVRVIIDFGDGVEKHFVRLPWQEKMTAWDATLVADQHPRGVDIHHRGKGDTLFVLQIDDVKNEGGDGRNWIFHVNDEVGGRGAAVSSVAAGDTVIWRFEKYR